jgi:hypothetical protein
MQVWTWKKHDNEIIKDIKTHKNKGQRKGLSLTFKQETRQDCMIQKIIT